MNALGHYSADFISEIAEIKTVLSDIILFLQESLPNLPCEQQLELRLIISELLANAVIHGNKCNPNKMVKVLIEIKNGSILVNVEDEGIGFDYKNFLDNFDKVKTNLLKDSGRGILIVYELSDTIFFNSKGNEINVLKKVNG